MGGLWSTRGPGPNPQPSMCPGWDSHLLSFTVGVDAHPTEPPVQGSGAVLGSRIGDVASQSEKGWSRCSDSPGFSCGNPPLLRKSPPVRLSQPVPHQFWVPPPPPTPPTPPPSPPGGRRRGQASAPPLSPGLEPALPAPGRYRGVGRPLPRAYDLVLIVVLWSLENQNLGEKWNPSGKY